jgi:prefoldin beta subunit
MAEIPEAVQEKIRQLQMMEQAMQQLLLQKHTFQMQLLETDSALKELEGKAEAYKIVGNIMLLTKKEDLEAELKEKKETTQLRISSLEKQEARTREQAAALQKEVVSAMGR